MNQSGVPYLCGGILFSLILEAKKTRRRLRSSFKNDSDGLRDSDVMIGLIEAISDQSFGEADRELIKMDTSRFRMCQAYGDKYIPFKKPTFISSFNSSVENRDPELLKKMTGFADKYLNEKLSEWLVKALFETITKDDELPTSTKFAVTQRNTVTKATLDTVTEVELPVFLISVFRFIFNERKDNTKGSDTFHSWFEQSGERTPWKLKENIGDGISWKFSISNLVYNKGIEVPKSTEKKPEQLPLPTARPQENIPYSEDDQALLKEFTSDYDEIMQALIRDDYADSLLDRSLPSKIRELYSTKWKTKADAFQDPSLKSQAFGLLGELNKISNVSFSKPYLLRQCRAAIRRHFVMLHPESYDGTTPFDVTIDDWNDGEF